MSSESKTMDVEIRNPTGYDAQVLIGAGAAGSELYPVSAGERWVIRADAREKSWRFYNQALKNFSFRKVAVMKTTYVVPTIAGSRSTGVPEGTPSFSSRRSRMLAWEKTKAKVKKLRSMKLKNVD